MTQMKLDLGEPSAAFGEGGNPYDGHKPGPFCHLLHLGYWFSGSLVATYWVWLKVKQPGLRRFWSMFPLTRAPFWYRFLSLSAHVKALLSWSSMRVSSDRGAKCHPLQVSTKEFSKYDIDPDRTDRFWGVSARNWWMGQVFFLSSRLLGGFKGKPKGKPPFWGCSGIKKKKKKKRHILRFSGRLKQNQRPGCRPGSEPGYLITRPSPCLSSRRPSRPRGVLCFLDVHPCVHASWFGGGGGGGVGGGV